MGMRRKIKNPQGSYFSRQNKRKIPIYRLLKHKIDQISMPNALFKRKQAMQGNGGDDERIVAFKVA
jgi:hypothetical protein